MALSSPAPAPSPAPPSSAPMPNLGKSVAKANPLPAPKIDMTPELRVPVDRQANLSREALAGDDDSSSEMRSSLLSTYGEQEEPLVAPPRESTGATTEANAGQTQMDKQKAETDQPSGETTEPAANDLGESDELESQKPEKGEGLEREPDGQRIEPAESEKLEAESTEAKTDKAQLEAAEAELETEKTRLESELSRLEAEQTKLQGETARLDAQRASEGLEPVTNDDQVGATETVPKKESAWRQALAKQDRPRRIFGGRSLERRVQGPNERLPQKRSDDLVGASRLQNEMLHYFEPGKIHQSNAILSREDRSDGSLVTTRADGVKIHQDCQGKITSVQGADGREVRQDGEDPTRKTHFRTGGKLWNKESDGIWMDDEGNRVYGKLAEDQGGSLTLGDQSGMRGQRHDGTPFFRDAFGTETWSYAGGITAKRDQGGDIFTHFPDGSVIRTSSQGRSYHRNNTAGRIEVIETPGINSGRQDGTYLSNRRNGRGVLNQRPL